MAMSPTIFLTSRRTSPILAAGLMPAVKFMDAQEVRRKDSKKIGSVDQGLEFIKDLYAIKKRAKRQELSPLELHELRQNEAKPILDEMHEWLVKKSRHVVPKSLLGKAIQYTLNPWHRLSGYLDFGHTTPDNNLPENAVRQFCVGRRNLLFAGIPERAQASATIYSLIESAKANKLEPYKYLRYLFEELPFAEIGEDYQ